jgi:hypothetical protein
MKLAVAYWIVLAFLPKRHRCQRPKWFYFKRSALGHPGQQLPCRQQQLVCPKVLITLNQPKRLILTLFSRPVFAFAKEFGSVGGQSASTLFSLGYTQDNAISFLGQGSGMTSVPSLWKSYFSNDIDAVSAI